MSKGKQPRSTAKVPKYRLSGKGCDDAKTTRMLAQKQPLIQRVRNSSLVERLCAENLTGLNLTPKLRQCSNTLGRGALYTRRNSSVSGCGVYRSENAGMSSANAGIGRASCRERV